MKKFFYNMMFFLAIGGPLLGLFGKWSIFLDILSNFRVQQTAFLAAVCLLLYLGKRYRKCLVALTVLIFCVFSLTPVGFRTGGESVQAAQTGAGDNGSLSLLLSNVYLRNKDYEKIIEVIHRESPDIVVLEEINNGWEQRLLEKLKAEYPVQKTTPREDGYGLAFFSKKPLRFFEVRHFTNGGNPSYRSELELAEGSVQLWVSHPLSPISLREWHFRNEEFTRLSQAASTISAPLVLVGDLNTTAWSPWFKTLLKGTKLRDGSMGFGVQKTWPAGLPGFFQLPLDHVLVSPEIRVLDYRVLEAIGSDHLPVLVRIGFHPKHARS